MGGQERPWKEIPAEETRYIQLRNKGNKKLNKPTKRGKNSSETEQVVDIKQWTGLDSPKI